MSRPRFPAGKAVKCAYEITSAEIPDGFDGFRIAHISDLHSRPASGTAEIISEEKPDITVITGDLLHDDCKGFGEVSTLLKRISAVSPVYIITGNHDVWRFGFKKIFKEFTETGAVFLDGGYEEIVRNGDKIALYGVGDPFSRVPEIISENVRKSFAALPEYDGYKILLFHRANLFDEIKDYGFDLILSGHMHGGQLCLPRLGGVLAPSSALLSEKRMLFPEYCRGEVHYGKATMVINSGLGNTLPLPRLGNPPEVGVVTLRKSKNTY